MRAILAFFRWLFTPPDLTPPEPLCTGFELADADREAIRQQQQSQLQLRIRRDGDGDDVKEVSGCRRGCPCEGIE